MAGLVIFLIRDSILQFISESSWCKFLSEQGFYLFKTKFLSIQEIAQLNQVSLSINDYFFPTLNRWQSGLIIVGFDLAPLNLTRNQKLKFPELDNGRYLLANKFNFYYQIPANLTNQDLIHLTKNQQKAEELLPLILPQEKENLQQKISQLLNSWITNYPVRRSLTLGKQRRAKVELINYQGKLAVKKTFRPGCERFFARELFVMSELGKMRPEIPSLLFHSSSFFICPFYERKFNLKSHIDLKIIKQIIQILRFFYNLGYSLIDFKPDNFIIDSQQGLKIIDFEFLYAYKNKPSSWQESYDLVGVPDDFDGDTPICRLSGKGTKKIKNYNSVWKPYLKLELSEIERNI